MAGSLPPGFAPSGGGSISFPIGNISDLVSLKERRKYPGLISFATWTGFMVGPFVATCLVKTRRKRIEIDPWTFRGPLIIAAGCFLFPTFLLPLKSMTGS